MDFKTATETAEAIIEKAIDGYRNDARFRAMVASSVSAASHDFGRRIDPDRADREAHEIAVRACALLLARVYHEDAEIATLKAERDRYKKLAEEWLLCAPPSAIYREPFPPPGYIVPDNGGEVK